MYPSFLYLLKVESLLRRQPFFVYAVKIDFKFLAVFSLTSHFLALFFCFAIVTVP